MKNKLVGKNLLGIWLNDDNTILKLELENENVFYITEADCCSETWWHEITFMGSTCNQKIVDVILSGLPKPENALRQEYDEVYGITLKLENGYIDLVYRNSSNGYYGGWCDEYKGSVTGMRFRRINKDIWNG